MTGSISRASERRVIVALTLLAAVLRLVRIGAQSLWVDEIFTLSVATPKPGIPLFALILHNIHGPLHTVVVALMRLVSENEGWLRLPSAVAGTLSVPLLYTWVRPRFGARAAGWAALLLAVNPLHIHYSQELRNYAFAVCFVLAGCVQLDRLRASWSPGRAAGFAACVAAAVLSNFSACFAFLVQSLVWFRGQPSLRRALSRWALLVAMVALITSPWIYRVTTYVDFGKLATPVRPGELDETERLRGDTTFRIESIPYTFYAYSVGFALGPTLTEMHGDLDRVLVRHRGAIAWTAVVFGTIALLGVRRALRIDGGWRAAEPVLYIAVPLAATLLLNWQNAKAFNVRYVLIGLPMYLALLGLGVGGWAGRRGVFVTGGLALATTAVALFNHYTEPARWKEDVRDATRAIEARLAPGECIFAPTVSEVVAHYRTTAAPLHTIYRGDPRVTERQFNNLFTTCPSFWYLRARPWVDDADGHVLATIDARYRRDAVMEFPGVTVFHFVPKN